MIHQCNYIYCKLIYEERIYKLLATANAKNIIILEKFAWHWLLRLFGDLAALKSYIFLIYNAVNSFNKDTEPELFVMQVGFGPVGSSTPAGSGGQQAQVATDGPDLIGIIDPLL